MRKPSEYHALGGQSFRVPSTWKYTIEKVKPSHGQPPLERTTKTLHTLPYRYLSVSLTMERN